MLVTARAEEGRPYKSYETHRMLEVPSHPLSQALGTPSAEFDTPNAFDGASGLAVRAGDGADAHG